MKVKLVDGVRYKYISKYSETYKIFNAQQKKMQDIDEACGLIYKPMCFVACGYKPIFDRKVFEALIDES